MFILKFYFFSSFEELQQKKLIVRIKFWFFSENNWMDFLLEFYYQLLVFFELLYFNGWKVIQLYGQKVQSKFNLLMEIFLLIAFVISLSLFCIVVTSVCVGALLPLILYKLNVDPVHASPTLQVMFVKKNFLILICFQGWI